ncbi:MAG: DNA polymerase III subunit beta [Gammaproteobacteria bacterium]|nr:DNA polymerase III subunit beta [Gammaproteobacteria bacterium]
MKFEVYRDSLIYPLSILSSIIQTKPTIPIFSQFFLSLTDSTLTIIASDSEIQITASVEIHSTDLDSSTTFNFTLPAKKFSEICRNLLPGSLLKFDINELQAILRSGRNRYQLMLLNPESFTIYSMQASLFSISLPQNDIKWLLAKSSFCMAIKDIRLYLNGLLLEFRGNTLIAVATDGHRLAFSSINLADDFSANKIILPRNTALELNRILENTTDLCNLNFSNSSFEISIGSISILSNLINEVYPDYDRVIPNDLPYIFTIDRELLKSSILRTASLIPDKLSAINFSFSFNHLSLSIASIDHDNSVEDLDIDFSYDITYAVGFNISYFLDVINAIDDKNIVINLPHDINTTSALFHGLHDNSYRYVIMPIKP